MYFEAALSGFDVLKIDDLTHLKILSRESLVELLNFYRQHAPGSRMPGSC